jgi:S1-C subfamily serine protease
MMPLRRISCETFLIALLAGLATARGQEAQPTLIQQLSADTQRLYDKVHPGIVRVQLPTPQWLEQLNEQKKLLDKWGPRLSPEVLQQLQQEQERARTEQYRVVGAVAASQPSESAATQVVTISPARNLVTPKIVLIASGLVFDTQGYVVVPLFVDSRVVGGAPLRVQMGDGQLTNARYVGSDRMTNLTVIQLENKSGIPAQITTGRPSDGSLTMVVSSDGGARLVVWTSQHPEPGLVVTPEGAVAGFGFNGHLLTVAACRPIVNQIIATGEVHRAVLGVAISEVRKEDALRQSNSALGDKPALRVLALERDSAADRGGLHTGDLILSIAGEPVGERETFAAIIASRSGKTDLRILRDSEVKILTVDLKPQ